MRGALRWNVGASPTSQCDHGAMSVRIDAPARRGETGLPDGRQLGWAEWGPVDGTVVLLIAGAATSRWLGVSAGVVESLGVRLISVDHPGLGVQSAARPDVCGFRCGYW